MIPMNSIVIAARPYLVLGAQSAAAGFAVFGGYAVGVLALAGTVNGISHIAEAASEVVHYNHLPSFLTAKGRHARRIHAERLEQQRLRTIIVGIFAEERARAANPAAGTNPKPDGAGDPGSAAI